MEEEFKDRKIRIAISLIYKRLLSPTCDIVDLSWIRQQAALSRLHRSGYMDSVG